MSKEIVNKGPLGGAVPMSGEPDYSPEKVKLELKKLDLDAIKQVEIEDPITGKKSLITIDRTGTSESKLLIALADSKLNRDQKDAVLSMYLFERGKESASFLVDLMRHKGAHTKETRAFRSQVRFDFEMFVSMFGKCLDDSAFAIGAELGYTQEKFKELGDKYVVFLKDCANRNVEDKTITAFAKSIKLKMTSERAAMIRLAFQDLASSEVLKGAVSNTAAARERDNGKGIYIDFQGRPYTIDDPDISDIIAKDQERLAELRKQDNGQN